MENRLNTNRARRDQLTTLKAHTDAVGLKWAAVQRFLPDWAPDACQHRAGLIELEGFVARHFGFKLLQGGGFEKQPLPQALFKLKSDTSKEQVSNARQFATSVARMAAQGCTKPWNGDTLHHKDIRRLALSNADGRGWVDFEALVETMWQIGIPVVYLPNLPGKTKKPDGMATFVEGRPVVVLMKQHDHPDWMLFILAHEIGHIAKDHVGTDDGAAVVDEEIRPGIDAEDAQEAEANAYASHVLVPSGQPLRLNRWPKAEQLAQEAITYGTQHGISPGHAILNAVRHTPTAGQNLYPLAMKALNVLKEQMHLPSTPQICRDAMNRHLDFDALKSDTIDFLEKLKVL